MFYLLRAMGASRGAAVVLALLYLVATTGPVSIGPAQSESARKPLRAFSDLQRSGGPGRVGYEPARPHYLLAGLFAGWAVVWRLQRARGGGRARIVTAYVAELRCRSSSAAPPTRGFLGWDSRSERPY